MSKQTRSRRIRLLMTFALIIFLAILAHTLVTGITMWVMVKMGVMSISGTTSIPYLARFSLLSLLVSLPIGILISFVVSQLPMKPVRDLINCMDALASGNYKTRFTVGPISRKYQPLIKISESFNTMAQDLENTEMLRSDFINNFSHEFKTPIVSISGFAKLLQRGNLTEEQKKEYLKVIEQESLRLSYMATNVLNLTKVENQSVLTDLTEYNLSEQIRSCILLLEDKWTKKNLDLMLDFEEQTIVGSEELLKQVWINLLDNAFKFSPPYQTVEIRITDREDRVCISIMNSGSEIDPDKLKLIFNKFYQADESHSTQGNGVGLAIVRRVTELHGGEVTVESSNHITTFTVSLPKLAPHEAV